MAFQLGPRQVPAGLSHVWQVGLSGRLDGSGDALLQLALAGEEAQGFMELAHARGVAAGIRGFADQALALSNSSRTAAVDGGLFGLGLLRGGTEVAGGLAPGGRHLAGRGGPGQSGHPCGGTTGVRVLLSAGGISHEARPTDWVTCYIFSARLVDGFLVSVQVPGEHFLSCYLLRIRDYWHVNANIKCSINKQLGVSCLTSSTT